MRRSSPAFAGVASIGRFLPDLAAPHEPGAAFFLARDPVSTLILHRHPPGATLTLAGAVDLTANYVRPNPDAVMVTILRGRAVVGAGEVHRVTAPLGEELPWSGEIEIEGVRFWASGRGTADGLALTLSRPRCPLHVPVPAWAMGMVAPRPAVVEGDDSPLDAAFTDSP